MRPFSRKWLLTVVLLSLGVERLAIAYLQPEQLAKGPVPEAQVRPEGAAVSYNRFRMLHPAIGRFMQRDPLESVDGMNLYGYVRSSPTNLSDATGLAANLCCCKDIFVNIDPFWTVYNEDGERRVPTGRPVWKLGGRMRSQFVVEGSINKCRYYQDESGAVTGIRSSIKHRWENDVGAGGGWVGPTLGMNQQITRANPFSWWRQERQFVYYIDPMGAVYNPPGKNRSRLRVRVRLTATLRCISSDGKTGLERDFYWGAKEVEAVTFRRPDNTFAVIEAQPPDPTVGPLRAIRIGGR